MNKPSLKSWSFILNLNAVPYRIIHKQQDIVMLELYSSMLTYLGRIFFFKSPFTFSQLINKSAAFLSEYYVKPRGLLSHY
jgi:hypothetical protein